MFMCGFCKHWKESNQPSGTGFCQICHMQRDETELCSCFKSTEFGDKIQWEKRGDNK
jgi:hypothetical protein